MGVVVLAVLIECLLSYASNGDDWRGTIRIVNGVTIVHNPEKGIWDKGDRPAVRLVEEGRIGSLEGAAET
ncbi:MAG: hypothetical protein ABFD80_12960, partial [Acidobacteriota bacterium]